MKNEKDLLNSLEDDEQTLLQNLEDEDTGKLPQLTPTGLPSMVQDVGKATNLFDPNASGVVQAGSQVLTTPERGMRGLGVLAQRGIQAATDPEFSAGDALVRAGEATKPGYTPIEGERVGSAVGAFTGSLPLATALSGVPGSSLGALGRNRVTALILKENPKLLAQALRQAGAGGALSMIEQSADKGEVDYDDVTVVAGTGLLLPYIVPTAKALGRAVRAFKVLTLKEGAALSREAAEEFVDNPKILQQVEGTKEKIRQGVRYVQETIKKKMDDAGEQLRKARSLFGIEEGIDDEVNGLVQESFSSRNVDDIIDESADLIAGRKNYRYANDTVIGKGVPRNLNPEKKFTTGLVPEVVDEMTEGKSLRIVKGKGKVPFSSINPKDAEMTVKQRVEGLYRNRQELNSYIKWRKGNPTMPPIPSREEARLMRWQKRINQTLDNLAEKYPLVKKLRDTDAVYHEVRGIFDTLQTNLVDESKAEQTLLKIAKGDSPDEILGLTGGIVERIRMVEQETGKKLLDPLRKEIMAYLIKNAKGATKFLGSIYEGVGQQGTAKALQFSQHAASVAQKLLQGITQPLARAAILSKLAQNKEE